MCWTSNGKMKLPDVASIATEKMAIGFLPGCQPLKCYWYNSGKNVSIFLVQQRKKPTLCFRLNAVDATIFQEKRCWRRYFPGERLLWLIQTTVNAFNVEKFWPKFRLRNPQFYVPIPNFHKIPSFNESPKSFSDVSKVFADTASGDPY